MEIAYDTQARGIYDSATSAVNETYWILCQSLLVTPLPIPEDFPVTADYLLYLGGALGVGDLGRHGELLGDELGGYLVHGVHGDGEAVGLLRVEPGQVVAEQRRGLPRQGHQHVLERI